jgi:hypothetical protein
MISSISSFAGGRLLAFTVGMHDAGAAPNVSEIVHG